MRCASRYGRARVQLQACNVRVQLRVQLYTVSPRSSPTQSSATQPALLTEPEWSRCSDLPRPGPHARDHAIRDDQRTPVCTARGHAANATTKCGRPMVNGLYFRDALRGTSSTRFQVPCFRLRCLQCRQKHCQTTATSWVQPWALAELGERESRATDTSA